MDILDQEIKVGSKVVFTDSECFPNDLLTVIDFNQYEIYLTGGFCLTHELNWLRYATPAEIAAGRRIDEPCPVAIKNPSLSDEPWQNPLPPIMRPCPVQTIKDRKDAASKRLDEIKQPNTTNTQDCFFGWLMTWIVAPLAVVILLVWLGGWL